MFSPFRFWFPIPHGENSHSIFRVSNYVWKIGIVSFISRILCRRKFSRPSGSSPKCISSFSNDVTRVYISGRFLLIIKHYWIGKENGGLKWPKFSAILEQTERIQTWKSSGSTLTFLRRLTSIPEQDLKKDFSVWPRVVSHFVSTLSILF